MKIDVDGGERPLLKGFEQTIRDSPKPTIADPLEHLFLLKPFYIEISPNARENIDFPNSYANLATELESMCARVANHIVSQRSLYLGNLAEIEEFIMAIEEMPIVNEVFHATAAPTKIRFSSELEQFLPNQEIPLRKLFGLKAKGDPFFSNLNK